MNSSAVCPACGRELKNTGWNFGICGCDLSRAQDQSAARDSAPSLPAGGEFELELECESEWESSGLALQEPPGEASKDDPMLSRRMIQGLAQATPPAPVAPPRDEAPASPPASHGKSDPTPATATTDTITTSDMLKKVNAALRAYADGEDVELPEKTRRGLPEDAINSQIAVANFAVLVKRLMLGISLRMPMLLAGPFIVYWLKEPRIAEYCGLRRPIASTTASDCMVMLRETSVLVKVGETKTWRGRPAYLYELAPVEVRGRGGEQPHAALVDDGLVLGAELEGAVPVRVAARNGAAAGGGGVHA